MTDRCSTCFWYDECLREQEAVESDSSECDAYYNIDEEEAKAIEEYREDLNYRDAVYRSVVQEQNQ